MDGKRQVLAALADEQQALEGLPADVPLAAHLPAAQSALEAFCRGDDAAMMAALKQVPFRSPYRDLRWLLGALACYPSDLEKGREFLAKIPPDSPFHCPAQVAKALLEKGHPPPWPEAHDFIAAFHSPTAADAESLLLEWVAQARRHPGVGHQAWLKALLVHYPAGLTVYEQHFGKLDDTERRRLRALYEEMYGDPNQACKDWIEVAKTYEAAGERLRAAAVYRHVADLECRLGATRPPHVGIHLQQALHLDPEHCDTWLKLAEYFRLSDDQKSRRQTLDEALRHFPDDPRIIAAAARAAYDRGAYKKAARLYGRLLQLDPINRDARWMLLQALMAQARKQLRAGRGDLARKELMTAAELATDTDSRAHVLALQGMVEHLGGRHDEAAAFWNEARRLLSPPQGDWVVAVTALLLERPTGQVKPLLKSLRQVMDHAALQRPDEATVLALLREAAALAAVDWEAAQTLLRIGSRYFKKALELDWSLEALRELGDLLLELECYQWLRDLARGHRLWSGREPLLVYLDVAAKGRGVPENLSPHDVHHLFEAMDTAAERGQTGLVQRIDALVRESRGPVLPPQPLSEAEPEEALARARDLGAAEMVQAAMEMLANLFAPKRRKP